MMDIQAVRDELAQLAPEGWEPYSYLPGSAQLPALVVGLPSRIAFNGSFGLGEVDISIILVVPNLFTKDAESKLLAQAQTIAKAYRSTRTGTTFRSCVVDGINQFYEVSVGSTDALSCSINLQLLIPDS